MYLPRVAQGLLGNGGVDLDEAERIPPQPPPFLGAAESSSSREVRYNQSDQTRLPLLAYLPSNQTALSPW